MIVDDSPEVRFLLSCAMSADGRFSVVAEAGTAAEAIDLAQQHELDVVLVDLILVGHDGAWLLRRLRESLSTARLVAVTGSTDEMVHDEARRAGADAVLVKRDLTTTLLDQIHEATQ